MNNDPLIDYDEEDDEVTRELGEIVPDAVDCPNCGNTQPDNGANMRCEDCGFAPMPFYNEDGYLVED